MIAGNTEVSQAICDCLLGALGVLADSQGTMDNFVWGNGDFQNNETNGGGSSVGPDFDGASAVKVHMTNTRMIDPEVLEKRFPDTGWKIAIRSDSGGKGKWRGGEGIWRQIHFNKPITITVLSSHRKTRPYGMAGGEDGAIGENRVIKTDNTRIRLQGNAEYSANAKDIFDMRTSGGEDFGA